MRRLTILALLVAAGCATSAPSPQQRYVDAINHRLDGDTKAEYDTLIALAHEAPDTREGRRARAILGGSDTLTATYAIGVMAAIAIPNFLKFQARAKQAEAKAQLEAIYAAMKSYYAEHGRYCTSFEQCDVAPEPGGRYAYLLGDSAAGVEDLLEQGLVQLGGVGVETGVRGEQFTVAAFGNVDGDADLDVWVIDERGELAHLIDDAS